MKRWFRIMLFGILICLTGCGNPGGLEGSNAVNLDGLEGNNIEDFTKTMCYADGWTIENNTIRNVTDGFAIYLDQCHNNTIRNNAMDGSRVFEVNSSKNEISGNQ